MIDHFNATKRFVRDSSACFPNSEIFMPPGSVPRLPVHRSNASLTVLVALSLLGTSGCGALTREEAAEAVEEVKVSSQASALTSESVEISANFTIGGAVKDAGIQLKEFIVSQMPCADVDLDTSDEKQATLTIEYGAKPGNCTFRGNEIHGRHIVSVARNEMDLVVVDHVWDGLSNGKVTVDGTATVEWDFENETRHVVHDASWKRLSDGRTGEGSGDRLQAALSGGIREGFSVNGERHWEGKEGKWDLDIDGVEMRWVDPVPQAGTYTLDTPYDKQLTLEFERASATAITVTVTGPRRSFDFEVVRRDDGDETTENAGETASAD